VPKDMQQSTTRAEAVAVLKAGYAELAPGQRITVRAFQPEDAPGISRLFYQVYGEDYAVDEPYFPERIVEADRAGRIHAFVAVLPDGAVAGVAALFQSSPPNKQFYEYGQMIVDKGYRNSSAVMRMHLYAKKNMFGRLDGVDAEYGEAVCHHLVSQKMSRDVEYMECVLEPGLMPEAAYTGEGISGRVSCLLQVRVNNGGAGPLFIPECWRAQVESLLPSWPLTRAVRPAADEIPADARTELEAQRFDFAGVTRLNVAVPGADFGARLAEEIDLSWSRGHAVVQVFLNLGRSWCGHAAGELRKAGFFFGGFLPLWFGDTAPGPDALLAQRFLEPVELAVIKTQSEAGTRVCAMVLADMARAGREFGAPVATALGWTLSEPYTG